MKKKLQLAPQKNKKQREHYEQLYANKVDDLE